MENVTKLDFRNDHYFGQILGKKWPKWTKIKIFETFLELDKNKIIVFFRFFATT